MVKFFHARTGENNMKISPKQLIILGGALLAIIVIVLLYFFGARPASPPKIALTVWGVSDTANDFEGTLAAYRAVRPNVTATYTKFDPAQYNQTLLEAQASGRGPDIFMIGNRALPRNINKLVPANPTQLSLVQFQSLFPRAPQDDFVASGSQVYAVPLYLDTLVLFYNKDSFDGASIVAPPKTWDEFQTMIPKLGSVDGSGQIVKAAAAIGGSEKTIPAAADILNLLMMQAGTPMVKSDRTVAAFIQNESGAKPGLNAFNFYLQFTHPASPLYTWNESQSNALDSFASGKTAMLFGYQSDMKIIQQKNPFLSFGAAPVPQAQGVSFAQSYPRYEGFAVSKQSAVSGWAWDFLAYIATNPAALTPYLAATGHPPAEKSLINANLSDPAQGVFAKQALTARTWYEADDQRIDAIFNTAIVNALTGKNTPEEALSQAQDQVTQLMR